MKINLEILEENESVAHQKFIVTGVDEDSSKILESLMNNPLVIGVNNKEKIGEQVIVHPITWTLGVTKKNGSYILSVN